MDLGRFNHTHHLKHTKPQSSTTPPLYLGGSSRESSGCRILLIGVCCWTPSSTLPRQPRTSRPHSLRQQRRLSRRSTKSFFSSSTPLAQRCCLYENQAVVSILSIATQSVRCFLLSPFLWKDSKSGHRLARGLSAVIEFEGSTTTHPLQIRSLCWELFHLLNLNSQDVFIKEISAEQMAVLGTHRH